jgi:hypothetical protein
VLEFPVPESKATYTAHHRVWRHEKVYTYTVRGSTVIEVTPRDENPRNIPIYERSYALHSQAPMKRVVRYAPDKVLVTW